MSDDPKEPGDEAVPPPELPSLTLAFELIQKRLEAQISYAGSLDTKASFVLGAASLLITAAVALHMLPGFATNAVARALAVFAIIFYLVVIYEAYRAYSIFEYKVAPKPRDLQAYYLDQELDLTREVLIDTWVLIYERNDQLIADKASYTRYALTSFAGEVFVLALVALVQIFT
jgi:hypothetical protein